MVKQVEFVGGPIAGRQPLMAGMSDVMVIPLDEELNPRPQEKPFAVALYRRQPEEKGGDYQFIRFERFDKKPFEVEFADGPNQGTHPCPQPANFHTKELFVPLTAEGTVFTGEGEPVAVAVYRSKQSDGKWRFHLDRTEESGESVEKARARVKERKAIQAIRQSYLSPEDPIYSEPPSEEHPGVLVEQGPRKAYVDEQIALLVRAIWQLGLETLGSCQADPSGRAYIGFPLVKHGKALHKMLVAAGVDAEYESESITIRDPDSGETIEVDAAKVLFSPDDIARITAAITPPAEIGGSEEKDP